VDQVPQVITASIRGPRFPVAVVVAR